MRQFRVLVNGSEYKVAIEELEESGGVTTSIKQPRQEVKPVSPKPVAGGTPKAAGTPKTESSGDSPGVITAAMPGTILDVKVDVGESVTRGQALLILEAMKMENEIMAPCDGVIGEIQVAVGASVNSGDVLVVMS
jgi:biotin carboxyl carrier protein